MARPRRFPLWWDVAVATYTPYNVGMKLDTSTGLPLANVLDMIAESSASFGAGHGYSANTEAEKAHIRNLIDQQSCVILDALRSDRHR